jgi:adenosine deaminase CECR1
MKSPYLAFLIIPLLASFINSLPLPYNFYSYAQARNKLEAPYDHYNLLTPKENLVSLYMEKMKVDEFRTTNKYFYPARPIETEMDVITQRPIYQLLKKIPKGGNIHMHQNQMLDRRKLLEIILNSTEYEYLYVCDKFNDLSCNGRNCSCSLYHLDYFKKLPVPSGWRKVKGSDWTIDRLVKKTTLTGILNETTPTVYQTDSSGRWALTNAKGVFSFYNALLRHNGTRAKYIRACLDSMMEENVQLIEFRVGLFGSLYYFDNVGNKMPVSETDELNMSLQLRMNYSRSNPSFIDFVYIINSGRFSERDAIRRELNRTMLLQDTYSDLIRGYDLVNEEDLGHTLLFHRDSLMQGFNFSQSTLSAFNLIFHSGETSWPGDVEPAQVGDSVATVENLFDAVLMKTRRIGHGLGVIKHPNLYKYMIERQIAIEICPTSNQILGNVAFLGYYHSDNV